MFSGLEILHPWHDPVFLFPYNSKRTIEFTMAWIFFLEKYGSVKSSCPPHKIKCSLPNTTVNIIPFFFQDRLTHKANTHLERIFDARRLYRYTLKGKQ